MTDRPFHLPAVETHQVVSRHVDQTYEISVMRPIMNKDGSERFPVIYTPDANSKFDAVRALAFHLQYAGLCPRFILVGIGYPGGDVFRSNMFNLRSRDLLGMPADFMARHGERLLQARASQIEDFQPSTGIDKLYRGAPDFLQFIRSELIPFIDGRYPTDPDDRGYFGFSAGGCLGLQAMFSEPDTFSRYIIGSPTLSFFGEDVYIDQAKAFIAGGQPLNAKVFLSVGGEEQGETIAFGRPLPSDPNRGDGMVSDFYRLVRVLARSKLAGLELTHRLIDNEVHMPGFAPSFTQGVRALYGRPKFVPI